MVVQVRRGRVDDRRGIAVAWPGLTIRALAITVGVALLVGGTTKILAAVFGGADEHFVVGLNGVTSVLFGVLALAWPDVTVLALAVLSGVATVVFGFGQIAVGLRLRDAEGGDPWAEGRRWPRTLRVVGAAVVFTLALGGMAISVAIDRAGPSSPGEFYTAPSPLTQGPPGTIIRSEVIDGYQRGATTYRVLSKSTGYDGEPTAVSGLILVPDDEPPEAGRRVVAYTHGTVGVASNCGPA